MIFFLIIALTSQVLNAAIMVQSQWSSAICVGPPTSVNVFYVNDTTSTSPQSSTETWPDVYAYFQGQSQGVCGLGNSPLSKCCHSSLDISSSVYQSAMYKSAANYDSTVIQAAMPISAKGSTYCNYQNVGNSESLYGGLTEIYILAGKCVDGVFCSFDGLSTLIYPSGTCTNATGSLSLSLAGSSDAFTSSTTTFLGSIEVTTVSISKASITYSWIAFEPGQYAAPNIKQALGVICLLAIIFTFGCLLWTVYFYLDRYLTQRTYLPLAYTVTQALWVIYTCFMVAYTFGNFKTELSLAVVGAFDFGLLNIASLASVLITTSVLVQVFTNSAFHMYMTFAAIFAIHISLAGSNYIIYFAIASGFDSVYYAYLAWSVTKFYWIIFMLIFNIIPVSYLTYRQIWKRNTNGYNRFRRLLKSDPAFIVILVGTVLNIAVFFTFNILIIYAPQVFRDDATLLSASTITKIAIALHSVMLCLSLDHVGVLQQNPHLMAKNQIGSANHAGSKFIWKKKQPVAASFISSPVSNLAPIIADSPIAASSKQVEILEHTVISNPPNAHHEYLMGKVALNLVQPLSELKDKVNGKVAVATLFKPKMLVVQDYASVAKPFQPVVDIKEDSLDKEIDQSVEITAPLAKIEVFQQTGILNDRKENAVAYKESVLSKIDMSSDIGMQNLPAKTEEVYLALLQQKKVRAQEYSSKSQSPNRAAVILADSDDDDVDQFAETRAPFANMTDPVAQEKKLTIAYPTYSNQNHDAKLQLETKVSISRNVGSVSYNAALKDPEKKELKSDSLLSVAGHVKKEREKEYSNETKSPKPATILLVDSDDDDVDQFAETRAQFATVNLSEGNSAADTDKMYNSGTESQKIPSFGQSSYSNNILRADNLEPKYKKVNNFGNIPNNAGPSINKDVNSVFISNSDHLDYLGSYDTDKNKETIDGYKTSQKFTVNAELTHHAEYENSDFLLKQAVEAVRISGSVLSKKRSKNYERNALHHVNEIIFGELSTDQFATTLPRSFGILTKNTEEFRAGVLSNGTEKDHSLTLQLNGTKNRGNLSNKGNKTEEDEYQYSDIKNLAGVSSIVMRSPFFPGNLVSSTLREPVESELARKEYEHDIQISNPLSKHEIVPVSEAESKLQKKRYEERALRQTNVVIIGDLGADQFAATLPRLPHRIAQKSNEINDSETEKYSTGGISEMKTALVISNSDDEDVDQFAETKVKEGQKQE